MTIPLTQQAKELTTLLKDNYSAWKYHEQFTLWGLSYFWVDGQISHLPLSNYSSFISQLFREMKDQNISLREPEYIVPRKRDPILHNFMFCLANRDGIENVLKNLLRDDFEEVKDLVNDHKLLREAMAIYAEGKKSEKFTSELDFTSFLLYYDITTGKVLSKTGCFGTLEPLARRLVFRYGEKEAEERMFVLAGEDLGSEVRDLHHFSLYGKRSFVTPGLVDLYHGLVGNGLPDNKEEPAISSINGIYLPGKRRIVRRHSLGIDWGSFLDRRKEQIKITTAFDLTGLMRQAIRAKLINQYLSQYELNPVATLAGLTERESCSKGVEQEIYRDLLRIFRGIDVLSHSDTIAHQMYVPIGKK